MNRQLIALIFSTFAMLCMGGCGDTRVTLHLQGLQPLNVNDSNESTVVGVRFYQLKNDHRFRNSSVDSLWTDDKKVLGDDLIGDPVTTTVSPGSAADAPVDLIIDKIDAGTHFIGVLALYHKSDAQDNRALVLPIETAGDKPLLFRGFSVTLPSDKAPEPEKHDPAPAPAKPAGTR
jgi:type VI secretion system VasD/TssJ family lipoprotein